MMPSLDASVPPDEVYEDVNDFRGGVVCVRRAFGCFIPAGAFQTVNGGCRHEATDITWSDVSKGAMSADSSVNYCAKLRQGGFADWIVPQGGQIMALGAAGMEAAFGGVVSDMMWAADENDVDTVSDYHHTIHKHKLLVNPGTQEMTWVKFQRYFDSVLAEEFHPKDLGRVVCVRPK